MKVRLELEVSDRHRRAIGDHFGTLKAAPEEGVRVWAQEVLATALKELYVRDGDEAR